MSLKFIYFRYYLNVSLISEFVEKSKLSYHRSMFYVHTIGFVILLLCNYNFSKISQIKNLFYEENP